MNANEKMRLSKEAEMQAAALSKINRWKNTALILSAIGVVLTYYGMAGDNRNLFVGISGIILIVVSTVAAVIFNLGLKNGRRNVGKILDILDEGVKS